MRCKPHHALPHLWIPKQNFHCRGLLLNLLQDVVLPSRLQEKCRRDQCCSVHHDLAVFSIKKEKHIASNENENKRQISD